MFKNYKFDPKDPSDKHTFEIHNIDISIINGIRRIILTDIPNVGIIGEEDTTVEIIKNDGPLHNEIISHRIGLLPICLNAKDIEEYEDNSIELELNLINQKNELLNVTTGHFKGKKNGKDLTEKELNIMFPVNPITKSHILITRLRTNEQLHFKAKVVKKTARYNAAFSPVSLSGFFYLQDPILSDKKDNILDKERSYYVNKYGEANAVQFELEPINKLLGPKYLINKSLDIIIEKLNILINNILDENIGKNGIIFNKYQDLENTYEFSIENEDDTLGNIIQSYVHSRYVREGNTTFDNIKCSYAGYICPHPLKTELLLRFTLDNQNEPLKFIKFLENNCKDIINELEKIKINWNKFVQ